MKKMIIIEILIVLTTILFFIFIHSPFVEILPACYIKENYGIICPSCGGTRCVTNFAKGNWGNSFQNNPIIFAMIIYLVILNIVYISDTIRKRKTKYIYPKWWYFVIWALILVVFSIVRNIWNISP